MSDRVALITGASRGIGRASAMALAARNTAVAINYAHNQEDAETTAGELRVAGADVMTVEADVGDPAAIEACFSAVESALGPVNILVNNAGIRRDRLSMSMSDAEWDAVLRTNLFGTFACSRRALRTMVRCAWGRIVNVSSVAAERGSPGQANYAAAKAGVLALTRTMAREVSRKGITVNAVAPGLIDTALTRDLSDKQKEDLVGRIPAGRAGSAEEVGETVAHLCSDEAAYITGAVLTIDGGMTA